MTLHTDLLRDRQGQPARTADGHTVEVVYTFCQQEGCDARLILWTAGSRDHTGAPRPRPTEAGTIYCQTHGFDRHLGRTTR